MAEEEETPGLLPGSDTYHIPPELSRTVPVHYANYTQLSVTTDGIGFLFCTKLDTLGQVYPNETAIPQVSVFMSLGQAELLTNVLSQSVAYMKAAIVAEQEKERSNVRQ